MAGFLVPRRLAVIRRRSTLEALLPEGHLARFLWDLLQEIDFGPVEALYKSVHGGPGRSPYHPRVLVALWIYGLMEGTETAAAIASACGSCDDFRWLAGGLNPSDQSLLNVLDLGDPLQTVWNDSLRLMQEAGLINLNDVFEDGTKLRANASPASFRTTDEIDARSAALKTKLDDARGRLPTNPKVIFEMRGLELRLAKTERAAQELRERAQRREHGAGATGVPAAPAISQAAERRLPVIPSDPSHRPRARTLFERSKFTAHPEIDAMICPAEQELRLVGEYTSSNGRGRYKLYRRRDCGDCQEKPQCTKSKGRQLKIPVDVAGKMDEVSQPPAETPEAPRSTEAALCSEPPTSAQGARTEPVRRGPFASVTEPEALMMLATSEKRWEPSYNADLTVTRDQIIVSQFLTKRPTDFHAFPPALAAVTMIGHPVNWVGDGHYGTQANLLLADREGVSLYAPSTKAPSQQAERIADSTPPAPSPDSKADRRFERSDFRREVDRDVLVCPADQELAFVGVYRGVQPYRLYRKADCSGCDSKARCTEAKGRRVKVPSTLDPHLTDSALPLERAEHQDLAALLRARDERMKDRGDELRRLRGATIEPVNAQLKQHGLGRFHVHGLARCGAMLMLACIGHNVMKWKARLDAKKSVSPAA